MTHQKVENSRTSGKRNSAEDPLGTNSEIGRKLRQYYDELVSDDIPDRFSRLLSELEEREIPQPATKED
ncbi:MULTISPECIES: NepR family anti-sigma factor [Phyllobacteriaceae]|uniref:NepR family anti-sigma factor n=1 Tax=Phyllobacteriaceae TaxID=69277 RepID=UPI002ACA52D3|nr:NepR family anti-sigma factor [Chelativorans sp. M5D2P16]MDZ5699144.1 NepR family anti-sigma factor [Chelativorans sp. M5D2P16]